MNMEEHPYARPERGPGLRGAVKSRMKQALKDKGEATWNTFVRERDKGFREGLSPKDAWNRAYNIAMGETAQEVIWRRST